MWILHYSMKLMELFFESDGSSGERFLLKFFYAHNVLLDWHVLPLQFQSLNFCGTRVKR